MHREYQHWYSPSLGREMELLIFGHAGARVLVFPTSMGRFFEWEDRGHDCPPWGNTWRTAGCSSTAWTAWIAKAGMLAGPLRAAGPGGTRNTRLIF